MYAGLNLPQGFDGVQEDGTNRAATYLLNNFWDQEYGGFYWLLDHQGNVIK